MRYPLLILFIFLAARSFSQALPQLIPYRDGDKWGYADSNGKVVIEPQWQKVFFFSGGKAIVEADSGYSCLIDTRGNIIIPRSLHWLPFHTRYAFNAHDSLGNYGYINQKGITEIPLIYQKYQT